MFGRKNYSRDELDRASSAVEQQFAAYKKLVKAIEGTTTGEKGRSALEDFEGPLFALEHFEGPLFNNVTLVLDRPFGHRLRMVRARTATRSAKSR
jgi:hypothetical protein